MHSLPRLADCKVIQAVKKKWPLMSLLMKNLIVCSIKEIFWVHVADVYRLMFAALICGRTCGNFALLVLSHTVTVFCSSACCLFATFLLS